MTWIVEVFRVLTAVMSTMMILSPIPMIFKVYKTRSTGVASITPLVSMLANCHIWLMYGYLGGNFFPIFTTFAFGEVASLCYISIFYKWTNDRAFAHKLFAGFGLVLALTTIYAVVGGLGHTNQTRQEVVNTIGYIGIVTSVVLYTSPFEKIHLVLKHRSAAFIPIHMVVVACINEGSWVVYALLISDWFIMGPNVFTFVVSVAQMVLYLVFHPSKHPLELPTQELSCYDLEMGHQEAKSPQASQYDGKINTANASTQVVMQSPSAPLH